MRGTVSGSRTRIVVVVILLAVVAAAAVWLVRSRDTATGAAAAPATRTIAAGGVTVTITPLSLDAAGARFDVAFDTHSGDINVDVAQAGQLLINGAPAPPGSWSGGGPRGHHRAGVLSYAAAVPPGATVELRLSGLPQAASATWTAP
jgi:hypothetical protein